MLADHQQASYRVLGLDTTNAQSDYTSKDRRGNIEDKQDMDCLRHIILMGTERDSKP